MDYAWSIWVPEALDGEGMESQHYLVEDEMNAVVPAGTSKGG